MKSHLKWRILVPSDKETDRPTGRKGRVKMTRKRITKLARAKFSEVCKQYGIKMEGTKTRFYHDFIRKNFKNIKDYETLWQSLDAALTIKK